MTDDDAIDAFACLANAARLTALKRLVASGTQGMSAGEIAKALDASPSRASFHLSALSKAGLVTSTRRAREIVYFVQFEKLGALASFLLEDCCAGNEIVRACCSGPRNCCEPS